MDTLWQNPEMASAMGRKAEQRYWDLFTADKMVASYIDLYRKLIDQAKWSSIIRIRTNTDLVCSILFICDDILWR